MERDAILSQDHVYSALTTALDFATDAGQHPGALFYGWVLVALNPAVPLLAVAEEVRDLNVYHHWSPFQLEGEITAKVHIPANQITLVEWWDGKKWQDDASRNIPQPRLRCSGSDHQCSGPSLMADYAEQLGLDRARMGRRIIFLNDRADWHGRRKSPLDTACAATERRDAGIIALLLDQNKKVTSELLAKAGAEFASIGLLAGYMLQSLVVLSACIAAISPLRI